MQRVWPLAVLILAGALGWAGGRFWMALAIAALSVLVIQLIAGTRERSAMSLVQS